MLLLVVLCALVGGIDLPRGVVSHDEVDVWRTFEHVKGTLELRTEGDVRELYTARAVDQGEEILVVPWSALLSRATVPELCPELKKDLDEEPSDSEGLVVACLALLVLRHSSHPAAALASKSCLSGGDLDRLWHHLPEGSYELPVQAERQHRESMARPRGVEVPDDVWQWAQCQVRQVGLPIEGALRTQLGSMVRVPLLQLVGISHARHNVAVRFDAVRAVMLVSSIRPLRSGEPLLLSRGCMSPLELLMMVGRVQSEDECDEVLLHNHSLVISSSHQEVHWSREALSGGDLHELIHLEVDEYAERVYSAPPLLQQLIHVHVTFLHRCLHLLHALHLPKDEL